MLRSAGLMAARDAAGATIPTAPSNVNAVLTGSTSARVTWTDNSNNEDQYNIYRSDNGGAFTKIATEGKSAEEHEDTTLSIGNTYAYKVSAENETGESAQAGPATVETDSVPDAPSNLQASTVSSSQVDLTWVDNATDESEYRIYKDDNLFDTIAADSPSYSATGLEEGTEFDWQVAAANAAGEARSATVSEATQLAAPSNLDKEQFGSGEFVSWDLSWTNNTSKAQNIELLRDDSVHDTLGASANRYSVSCPEAAATWNVRAVHSSLPDSDKSNATTPAC